MKWSLVTSFISFIVYMLLLHVCIKYHVSEQLCPPSLLFFLNFSCHSIVYSPLFCGCDLFCSFFFSLFSKYLLNCCGHIFLLFFYYPNIPISITIWAIICTFFFLRVGFKSVNMGMEEEDWTTFVETHIPSPIVQVVHPLSDCICVLVILFIIFFLLIFHFFLFK